MQVFHFFPRLFHCQFCISTCAITAATHIYIHTPTPTKMVATRVLVYTIRLHTVQFLQLANGEWCHWCSDIVLLCCVVGGRHGFGECMQRNFILFFLNVCVCVWVHVCEPLIAYAI